jgi:thiol-disulfide isomerase/thioredoxin
VRTTLATLLLLIAGCGGAPEHGRFSALTANASENGALCEHRVPAEACTRCEPSRAADFKAVGDWCSPHAVPESQCHTCHGDLSFDPLPEPPEGADIQAVPRAVALAGLKGVVAPGKVTVVDFWAVWCVPCRRTAGDLNLRLRHDPTLAVRKIQVRDWDDPLAAKYLAGTPDLPLLVVFDAKGAEVGRVKGHRPAELDALLARAHR